MCSTKLTFTMCSPSRLQIITLSVFSTTIIRGRGILSAPSGLLLLLFFTVSNMSKVIRNNYIGPVLRNITNFGDKAFEHNDFNINHNNSDSEVFTHFSLKIKMSLWLQIAQRPIFYQEILCCRFVSLVLLKVPLQIRRNIRKQNVFNIT